MPLLKFINSGVFLILLSACTGNQVKTMVDANVESSIIEVPAQAATDFKAAITLMNDNKLNEALILFEAMTETYPQLSGPYANIGVIYSKKKQWIKSKEALLKSVECNQNNIKALNQLGLVYRHLGDFKSAEEKYLLAIGRSPKSAESYLNIGVLYDIYMGKLVQAREYYQKYQTLNNEPNNEVAGWIVDINRRVGSKAQIAGESR